ncbi:polysaccharide pyruvyl transferase family protein [Chloroflexi bacterium TSY]|nr:polysaccharide pyruvyl transferase family protein [Chloroflexi bacterium TSY]
MTNKRPTILVHSGWNRYNFGDVAHTPGLLHLLEKYIPEAEVWLWMARYPEWLAGYILERFPNTHVFHGQFGGIHGAIDQTITEAYERADLFIYNSGPIFNYGHEIVSEQIKTEGWRGFDWNATMEPAAKLYYAKHMHVPFGIFAQSFIYFAPPADIFIPEILSQATFLTTRETDSLTYLQQLGVHAPDMDFTPDAAWAFDLKDDERVVPWLDSLGLNEREFLVATTRNAPAGVDTEFDKAKQTTFFAQVLTDWIEQTGLPVLLIPETVGSIQLNREYILEASPPHLRSHIILDNSLWMPEESFWTPDQALSVLSRARAYLNVDHHGVLMALAAGTPCVHPHQPQAGRKSNALRDIGLNNWLFALYDVDPRVVSQTLLQIHQEYDLARQQVEEAVKVVQQAHKKRMMAIRNLLELP